VSVIYDNSSDAFIFRSQKEKEQDAKEIAAMLGMKQLHDFQALKDGTAADHDLRPFRCLLGADHSIACFRISTISCEASNTSLLSFLMNSAESMLSMSAPMSESPQISFTSDGKASSLT